MKRLLLAVVLVLSVFALTARAADEVSISAQDTYSAPVLVRGDFSFYLRGTWVATVVLQRSFDGGATWGTVMPYMAPIEENGHQAAAAWYRFGVPTGSYTSGTVKGRIVQ